jgi:hypothetical protein
LNNIPPEEEQIKAIAFRVADGHIWHIATHKEDLSPEEIKKRAASHVSVELFV